MSNMGQICPDVSVPFSNDYFLKLTAGEISNKIGMNRKTVSRQLNRLVGRGLLMCTTEGRNKKYYLDLTKQRTRLLLQMAESEKALSFSLEHKDVFVALMELVEMNELVLFGSYAKGTATSESDVDVLVLGKPSETIRGAARKQIKRINLHFSTIAEFEEMLKEKNVLALEIVKNHIVFGGSKFFDICWRFYRNEI